MLRRFDEPIEVRVEDEPVDGQAPGTPRAFLWRGRVYAVRGIDGHWSDRRAWWRGPGPGLGDRQVWRVRAQAGRSATPVIAELGTDGPAATDPWVLLGILD